MVESVRYRVTLITTETRPHADVDVILENYCISSCDTKQCTLHIFTSSDTDAPLLAPEHGFV